MNEVKEKKEESGLKAVTLKELGTRLSLGNPNASYNKTLEIRPWRMKEEKELGRLKKEAKKDNLTSYLPLVIGTLCTKVGEHDFTKMKDIEKRLVISQMWLGDVWTAYCLIRIKSMGSKIDLKPVCSHCGKTIEWVADLNTLEVNTANEIKDCLWEYELEQPIVIRGKERTKFTMGPMRLLALEALGETDVNIGSAKDEIISGSIHKIDGQEIILAKSDLDELVKIDIEKLTAKINEKNIGPNMSIEGKCPHVNCGENFKYPIDWGFDSFFGISSQ
jgi:hypothetical protein